MKWPGVLRLSAGLFVLGVAPSAHAFSVIHSNDVMGDIEPCGCQGTPKGGMVRKETFLRMLNDPQSLQLDAGDLLFSTDLLPELLQPQSELQARYLLQAMELLGHAAITPGEKDFALGVEAFERLRKSAKINFLSANLLKRDGTDFLKPYLNLTRKSKDNLPVRITIIGISGNELKWPKELKVESPTAAAKHWAGKLRNDADLLIALTHQGHEQDKKLAQEVPHFDIIIGGHSQSFVARPVKIGKTLILESAYRNQYLGVLPILGKGEPASEEYRQVALDELFDPALKTSSPMQNLVAEFRKESDRVKQAFEKSLNAAPKEGPNTPLLSTDFQTAQECKSCHQKQERFWKNTAHAKAWKSLTASKDSQNATDPKCIVCHALPLVEGIEPTNLPKNWKNVQCENCHGPGKGHPFSSGYVKAVADEVCLRCHTEKWSPSWYKPGFDLKSLRKKVSCPADQEVHE